MKRCLVFKLALFLLLGAIVNVAVAWGCVLWSADTTMMSWGPRDRHWLVAVPEDWPAQPGSVSAQDVFGFTDAFAFGPSEAFEFGPAESRQRAFQSARTFGLPLRGVCSVYQTRYYLEEGTTLNGWFAWPIPKSWLSASVGEGRDTFPTKPLWPGFAINTVFYAFILWLLFAATFALRRRRRIKRGLCPKCAYDLRGGIGETCPECGAAVNRIAR